MVPDLLLGRLRIGVQQFLPHQHHSRRPEPALKCAVRNESLLDGIELVAFGKALDRQDLRAIDQRRQIQAARYGHAIHQYGATAAQALATTFARSVKTKLTLQHLDQILVYSNVCAHLTAVQSKTDGAPTRPGHFTRSSFIPEGPVLAI